MWDSILDLHAYHGGAKQWQATRQEIWDKTSVIMKPRCYLTTVERRRTPCYTSDTPELWWGPDIADGVHPSMIASEYDDRAIQARIICCTQCPLHEQQECAKEALRSDATSGVWGGVKLPCGGINQYRVHDKIVEARKDLQRVADGLGAHELSTNALLLEQNERRRMCKRCNTPKPLHAFYLDKNNKPIRGSCKACKRADTRQQKIAS